ncbi:gamma-glutamyltransferase [Rubrobacter indicoceani]|uniref:gamma-glutamyltransferase n=1 Tax=Rubrobacter indicoceani TaxID=2051957 RepID=UPI000E5B792C|nr:gamma-glutamyltransferase [Rubrobacter indicoceani]
MSNPNGPKTGRPPTYAPNGVVSSPHHLASSAGLRVLRAGGSAVDAAIATNAVLCVIYPHMAGLGGDGFWLIHDPVAEGVTALNASGPAARAATRDFYKEKGNKDAIPERGPLAALTVPGAVDGWHEAHERHGKLSWEALFTEAIEYAKEGAPVGRSLTEWTAKDASILSQYPVSARTFLPNGRPLRDGERLVQPELAESLYRLATEGAREGFYEGETAERVCEALAEGGSPLSFEDFREFRAEWVEPISTDYRGYTAYEFPPNTQGFAALQILNLLEGYDVAAWGDGSADYYHHMAEAVKLAFADRDEWLTDGRFVDIPIEQLVSKDYADERRKLIDPERAMVMEDVEPGLRFRDDVERRSPDGDTCYFCAVDRDGLVVSVIQSVYHDFGTGVVVEGTGIIPQNRGSFFSLDARHPNCLEPGKRTFHTLIPAMLLKDRSPYLTYGTMGGEGQPQTHAALVTRLVDFGYDVQQAIEAPRWLMGRTWGVTSQDLSLEGRISDEVMRELELRGQPVKPLEDYNDNVGHAQAIRLNRDGGFFEGGADPRGDGAALGY